MYGQYLFKYLQAMSGEAIAFSINGGGIIAIYIQNINLLISHARYKKLF